jgi:hypothetical protein
VREDLALQFTGFDLFDPACGFFDKLGGGVLLAECLPGQGLEDPV